jgi:DNA invertase Pin-like site-specific DNA recombinase
VFMGGPFEAIFVGAGPKLEVINFGRTIPIGAAWLRTAHGRLMLTVLGGLAEFERELILTRTSDGRTRAKARGVKFGRPPSLTAHQRQEVIERLAKGEAQADIARSYAVSQSTISRLAPAPFVESAAGL